MNLAFGWLVSALLLTAAYPWSVWLVRRSGESGGRWLAALVALGLGMGVLTQVMFWEALFGLRFELSIVLAPCFLLMLPGGVLWWRERRAGIRTAAPPQGAPELLLSMGLLIFGAAVLFNAVYWPFSRDDALGIYAPIASIMYTNRGLAALPGAATLYEAYPIHIPLTYTFAYLAAGWENEYLARVFPTLLSLGCLPGVYVLGRTLGGRSVGWASAALLAVTPTVGRWASSGYVDLPMAFYYLLAAIFVYRHWRSSHWTDALLAGVMMGLAAWTKNAALLGVALLALWFAWERLMGKITLRQAMLPLLACVLIAGPWYLRNLLEAGMLIPDTAWVEQAQRSLANLLALPRIYGLPGGVMMVGILYTLWSILRRRLSEAALPQNGIQDAAPRQSGSALLLLWTVPFYLLWWWFASYDPRFLLLFMPILCVMAGLMLKVIYNGLRPAWQPGILLAVLALTLALLAQSTWNSVEYKNEILRNPLLDNTAKVELVRGHP